MNCKKCGAKIPDKAETCLECGAPVKKSWIWKVLLAIGCLVCLGISAIAILLGIIIIPNFCQTNSEYEYKYCKSNLKNVAYALEMYAADNNGLYPPSLDYLTKPAGAADAYLQSLPKCLVTDTDTYSPSYKITPEQDRFRIYCSGSNHKIITSKENLPGIDSVFGLYEEPVEDMR
ncbi:MAG: zinc-ribbon domain-containing protein [bacterium]|nr:zinc-ribbon domain-containing protein [bacterium]